MCSWFCDRANGELIVASDTQHQDLFWALKGGGGNFGVVTRFTFKGYKFGPNMRIGAALYKPEDAAEALREYAKIYPTLPNTVGWHAALNAAKGDAQPVTTEKTSD